ncbi:MAG: hypothetical protein ABW216_18650 [Candidatus Rokuibacteriota bacterium]|jgi:thiamine phosphate synthase YjbQ (UPF0047 family)|nr:hypothetical protein [Patescibacteria group bacterium]
MASTAQGPLDLTLELAPRARFDVVELRSRLSSEHRDALAPYPYCLYWSAHTTAGFLDRSLITRLGPGRVPTYVDVLRRIFPEGAGYAHDHLERRIDLDPAQRAVEPKNADSHLAYIAGGLCQCVTHPNRAGETVYFVDLDGVNEGRPRRRQTRVIGFQHEAVVAQIRLDVPMSRHPIESVNLKDPRLGLYDRLAEFVSRAGVGTGRLHLALDPAERHAALTVNEFETLLMKYDLAAVLREPLRFMAAQYRGLLANPRAVPGKALGYAKYDLVRVINSGLDTLGLQDSIVEKVLARTLAVPAARFFRIRRSVHLLVAEREDGRRGFVEGTYQSPILVQWQRSPRATRVLHATLTRLE